MAALDDAARIDPSFTSDVAGSYVIALTINDGSASSVTDNVRIDAIRPTVQLFRESSGFFCDGAFNETGLPYASNSASTVSISGIPVPTTYTLDTFKLVGTGATFTIDNLYASDAMSRVSPFFTKISTGYVLADGEEVEFELAFPLTRGANTMLEFGFEIRESGEKFTARYSFLSN